MILLDTDHLSVLQIGKGERFNRLVVRLAQAGEPLTTTIVTAEEQLRGWLSSIAGERDAE